MIRLAFPLFWDGLAGTEWPFPFGGDGADYVIHAENISDGNGFIGLTNEESGRPPLWPMVLSGPAALTDDVQVLQVFAALIGTATVAMIGLVGRRLGGQAVGLMAAAIAAVDPGLWIFEWPLLAEPMLMLGLATFLYVAYGYLEHPTLTKALVLGALTSALAMTRSEQILLSVLVVVPLILTTSELGWADRIRRLAGAGAVAVLVLTPWFVFNQTRFEDPVLLSTGLGNTLVQGYCDSTFYGERTGYFDAQCSFRLLLHPSMDGLDQSEADPILRREAFDYAGDNLDRLVPVVVARQGRVWGFFRPASTVREWADLYVVPRWATAAWFAGAWVLALFAVYGAVTLRGRSTALYPLLGPFVIVVFVTGFTIGEPRYRAAAEPSLILLAAVGLVALLRHRPRRAGPDATEELSRPDGESDAKTRPAEPVVAGTGGAGSA